MTEMPTEAAEPRPSRQGRDLEKFPDGPEVRVFERLFEVLLPDGRKLWPDWLRRFDTLLEDEAVIEAANEICG